MRDEETISFEELIIQQQTEAGKDIKDIKKNIDNVRKQDDDLVTRIEKLERKVFGTSDEEEEEVEEGEAEDDEEREQAERERKLREGQDTEKGIKELDERIGGTSLSAEGWAKTVKEAGRSPNVVR